jgi:hypothetical protein
MGGLMKRNAMMERTIIAAITEIRRNARLSQGCFFRLMLRFRMRSPETAWTVMTWPCTLGLPPQATSY